MLRIPRTPLYKMPILTLRYYEMRFRFQWQRTLDRESNHPHGCDGIYGRLQFKHWQVWNAFSEVLMNREARR